MPSRMTSTMHLQRAAAPRHEQVYTLNHPQAEQSAELELSIIDDYLALPPDIPPRDCCRPRLTSSTTQQHPLIPQSAITPPSTYISFPLQQSTDNSSSTTSSIISLQYLDCPEPTLPKPVTLRRPSVAAIRATTISSRYPASTRYPIPAPRPHRPAPLPSQPPPDPEILLPPPSLPQRPQQTPLMIPNPVVKTTPPPRPPRPSNTPSSSPHIVPELEVPCAGTVDPLSSRWSPRVIPVPCKDSRQHHKDRSEEAQKSNRRAIGVCLVLVVVTVFFMVVCLP